MNELIIIGILGVAFLAVIAVTEVIESEGRIGVWLWSVQTAYYKWKHFRRRGVYAWEVDFNKWK